MINNKKIIVVMPAYNAGNTLKDTMDDINRNIVDEIILVDDHSRDNTLELSKSLGIRSFVHYQNFGYGRNQKTCYREALRSGADVIVMLHPDCQYDPKLIEPLATLVANEKCDIAIGSRVLCDNPIKRGMPISKYIANKFLTFIDNIIFGTRLSEYHTGYKAYAARVFKVVNFEYNSDDFLFSNQIMAQAIYHGFLIGEIHCPARYFQEASTMNWKRSVTYSIGVIHTAIKYFLHKHKLKTYPLFDLKKDLPDLDYYKPY